MKDFLVWCMGKGSFAGGLDIVVLKPQQGYGTAE